jgi:hypothetical protein
VHAHRNLRVPEPGQELGEQGEARGCGLDLAGSSPRRVATRSPSDGRRWDGDPEDDGLPPDPRGADLPPLRRGWGTTRRG